MDREKAIKEITEIINERCEAKLGQVHATYGKVTKTVDTSLIAKDIYNAGYRKAEKAEEVHRETARACMKIVDYELKHTDNEELKVSLQFILGEIATENGVEVK